MVDDRILVVNAEIGLFGAERLRCDDLRY